ncbi:hypothetical protein OPT61_g4773 [Boeremia exigua]|uniref:Uncharacterized protein n=1 Tax=Boeremia exigua TaxID=749465 RepID=A0ACC2ICY9_9PLEO|nr:hypothetical protein OPT61_g4773 [Boeremia exigua]
MHAASGSIFHGFAGQRLARLNFNHGSRSKDDDLGRWNRTRAALERCMLLISDLQLITGLAIITSGFAQLRCGISAYHWKRVVQLTWFSSITHLCCLTFLRDFLYANRSAQLWRVPGMLALIIMLVTALGFTAHFAFNDPDAMLISRPRPHDYAICFLNHHEILSSFEINQTLPEVNSRRVIPWAFSEFKTSRDRVICSTVLLALGALNRVWRLYDAPSIIYSSLRTWLGQKLVAWLETLYSDRSSPSWGTVLVYCPILALVLGLHAVLDIFTSKFFEVWWLLVSFTWGASNLWPLRITVHESGIREWTFGQMIAILILVAPAVTLAESFLGSKSPNPSQNDYILTSATQVPNPIILNISTIAA